MTTINLNDRVRAADDVDNRRKVGTVVGLRDDDVYGVLVRWDNASPDQWWAASALKRVAPVLLDTWLPGALRVVQDVLRERREQVRRYGLNEATQDGTGPSTRWLLPFTSLPADVIEADLRADYEDFEEEAPVTWVHLLREEMAEAFMEADPEKLYEEVLQIAALAISWCEKLNTRLARKEKDNGS